MSKFLLRRVILIFLTTGISFSATADVLSFSIIHEKFELNRREVGEEDSRMERLRRFFLEAPIDESQFSISSRFGFRSHPVLGRQKMHKGVDYTAPKGTPIVTVADGQIEFVGRQNGYGKVVVVRHNENLTTLYAHQSRFAHKLEKGAFVSRGDTIGYVGSTGMTTGNNLHYEVRLDNDPIDPLEFGTLYAGNEQVINGID